ncbi:flagellar type III secretion system pore protein FliP [Catenovulum sp. SM1970]|uniref:flagellar type III secretion system pore protein FliP n=1 Tax=Marinifaba aquimaris TaxID=2741323 RepID=UPI001573C0D5|nr:flagellar type III secretion system pore protein FliP [Marinifaba aquimaris]NTS77375.1 flagellar type III secretion system pore protein FliP [Marinifaba aquimaris]
MIKLNFLLLFLYFVPNYAMAASGITDNTITQINELAPELKIAASLGLLSFLPIALIATTAFTRIIIVLAMLRHALGLQQSPPNIVLITLALFLTFFTMSPVYEKVNEEALKPYLNQEINYQVAFDRASKPIKAFMLSQTSEDNFQTIIKMSGANMPNDADEVSFVQLIPAFLLSELTTAFKIAFVIFLPFLAIDLITASTLMSLGMIMVPPITVALPLKVMLFVLIDGWGLIAGSLISSFIN